MKKNIILLGLFILSLASCGDFLNLTPKNKKVVYSIVEVKTAMSSYLNATLYSYANSNGSLSTFRLIFNDEWAYFPIHRNVDVAMALYGDDLNMETFIKGTDNTGGYPYRTYYYEMQDWTATSVPAEMWQLFFVNVGYMNTVLHDLENVPDKNQVDYEQIAGEARVHRAYFLFKLNQYFAPLNDNELGIPMNLDAEVYEGQGRWKQTEIYETLIRELEEVLAYATEPRPSWNIMYRKEVIHAILAQIYMYKACSCAVEPTDWANAEKYSVLAMAGKKIEGTLEEYLEIFKPTAQQVVKNSPYTLLKYEKFGDMKGDNYAPWGKYEAEIQTPVPELLELFKEQPDDIRYKTFFRQEESGVNNTFVTKIRYGNAGVDNCIVLFRTSEMALIEAEAMARQNKESARTKLNDFRRIKGCTDYTGNNVLEEILKERRKELCFESDYRWLDMKRLGVSVTRTVIDKENNEPKDVSLGANDYRYAMPIPADYELQFNPILQNPGWSIIAN